MNEFDSVLNEAIRLNVNEVCVEINSEISFITDNTPQKMQKFNVISEDSFKEIAKKYLDVHFQSFDKDHPQKHMVTLEKHIIHISGTYEKNAPRLHFFLPPKGEALFKAHWEKLSQIASPAPAKDSSKIELPFDINSAIAISPRTNNPPPKKEPKLGSEVKKAVDTENPSLEDMLKPSPPKEVPKDVKKTEATASPELTLTPEISFPEAPLTVSVEPLPSETQIEIQDIQTSKASELNQEINEISVSESAPTIEVQSLTLDTPTNLDLPQTSPNELEVKIESPSISISPEINIEQASSQDIKIDTPDNIPVSQDIKLDTPSSLELSTNKVQTTDPTAPNPPAMQIPKENIELHPSEATKSSRIENTQTKHQIPLLDVMESLKATHLHLISGQKPSLRIEGKLINYGDKIMDEGSIVMLLSDCIPFESKGIWQNLQEFDFMFDDGKKTYRVHTFKDLNGRNAVLRILSRDIPSFEQLKLAPRLQDYYQAKRGLLVIAAASDLLIQKILASMIQELGNSGSRKIISLEKQIYYKQDSTKSYITQREVGLHTASFPQGLQAALQENCDLIFLSHLSDKTIGQLALISSEQGLVSAGLLAHSLKEAKSVLDSLLSESPQILVETLLLDLIFASTDAGGNIVLEFEKSEPKT